MMQLLQVDACLHKGGVLLDINHQQPWLFVWLYP